MHDCHQWVSRKNLHERNTVHKQANRGLTNVVEINKRISDAHEARLFIAENVSGARFVTSLYVCEYDIFQW